MSGNGKKRTLRLPAFRVTQGNDGTLYSFVVDGKKIPEFASISHVGRDEDLDIVGYQRPEIGRHIREIRDYIESENPIIPNAIVICFDETIQFVSTRAKSGMSGVSVGHIVVPLPNGERSRPGWIVDGQQRVAAIRDANVESFPICAIAFIATSEQEQREQFILVNSTKPLPKGLVYELLPHTGTKLASALERRRFPATVAERLNQDHGSPMRLRIHTPTNPAGIIKDNSVLKMIENSMTDGALYRFRDSGTGEGDIEKMLKVLNNFWTAVSELFEAAWNETPRRSRLVHGAGVVSMGFLMDAIADAHWSKDDTIPTIRAFRDDLLPLADCCHWMDGIWPFGDGRDRKWNELQNTPKDLELLTDYLLTQYKYKVTIPRSQRGLAVELPG